MKKTSDRINMNKVKSLLIRNLVKVRSARKELKAYCHSKRCKNVFNCPQLCTCDKYKDYPQLDLDTSLAWVTSSEVGVVIGCMSYIVDAINVGYIVDAINGGSVSKSYIVELIKDLCFNIKRAEYHLNVAIRVIKFHGNKYDRLFDIVIRTHNMFYCMRLEDNLNHLLRLLKNVK